MVSRSVYIVLQRNKRLIEISLTVMTILICVVFIWINRLHIISVVSKFERMAVDLQQGKTAGEVLDAFYSEILQGDFSA